MTPDETEVLAAAHRFYAAIEDIIVGKGMAALSETWHHTPRVSSGHPTGEWAYGWDEVAATWEVFASLGKPENAGSSVRDLRPQVYGDLAYVTGVFQASPSWGGASLNVTNILHRANGVWKLVHHHVDKAPSMERSLDQMSNEV